MLWKKQDLLEVVPIRSEADIYKFPPCEYIDILRFSNKCAFVLENRESKKEFTESDFREDEFGFYIELAKEEISRLRIPTNIDFKAYKRKYNLLIAGRADAFGSRMSAFVTAIYLARKLGFKFGFVWNTLDKDKSGAFVEKCENLFEKDFLEEYDYSRVLPLRGKGNTLCFRTIQELRENPCFEPWGTWVMNYYIPTERNIPDIDMQEYKREFREIFLSLPFKESYKKQIQAAMNLSGQIGDCVAIHMRSGDSIETGYRRFIFCPVIHKYIFPVDLTIFAARHFIQKGFKVLLFGADKRANQAIESYLSDEVKLKRFYNVSSLGGDLTEMQRVVFEITLMSSAKKVIANHSTFSKFAVFLGVENELINFNQYFTQQELYNAFILPKQKDFLNISNIQKAVSCGYAYLISRNIKTNIEERVNLLHLALEFDACNSAYRVMLVDEFFRAGQVERVENYLKYVVNERAEEFISSLLLVLWNQHIVFKEQFKPYLHNANPKFPYISFCAFKISEFCKDDFNASRFLNFTLSKTSVFEGLITPSVASKHLSFYNETAKSRIHSHLAYKLGSAMILNSKSLWGYIRMPYVLSYIKESHRIEQQKYQESILKNPKLKLPKLESYPDYKEAIKEKECFTYKLGAALIQADKDWYKGGYLRFYFKEVPRLKREFREREK